MHETGANCCGLNLPFSFAGIVAAFSVAIRRLSPLKTLAEIVIAYLTTLLATESLPSLMIPADIERESSFCRRNVVSHLAEHPAAQGNALWGWDKLPSAALVIWSSSPRV